MSGPPPPSSASLATYGTSIGNDGWIVTFGDGAGVSTTAGPRATNYPGPRATDYPDRQPDWLGNQFEADSYGGELRPLQAGYSMPMWAIAGVLAVLAVRAIRSKT